MRDRVFADARLPGNEQCCAAERVGATPMRGKLGYPPGVNLPPKRIKLGRYQVVWLRIAIHLPHKGNQNFQRHGDAGSGGRTYARLAVAGGEVPNLRFLAQLDPVGVHRAHLEHLRSRRDGGGFLSQHVPLLHARLCRCLRLVRRGVPQGCGPTQPQGSHACPGCSEHRWCASRVCRFGRDWRRARRAVCGWRHPHRRLHGPHQHQGRADLRPYKAHRCRLQHRVVRGCLGAHLLLCRPQ